MLDQTLRCADMASALVTATTRQRLIFRFREAWDRRASLVGEHITRYIAR